MWHLLCESRGATRDTVDSNRRSQFRVDQYMYHISLSKTFLFNIALAFLVGAGSFILLLPLSSSPRGALFASFLLSFALNVVIGCSLYQDRSPSTRNII
jgi:hypothetical protein